MINFKQLEAFVLVAEQENFTRAAKALYMTQPAISFQIKALEEHFQCQLFERLEKRTILTEAGKILYPAAKNILAAYEKTREAVNELQGLSRGTIIVGSSTIPGEYLLPLYIGAFKSSFPGIQVNLQITDSSQVVENLLTRQIDLGVIGAYYQDKNLEYRPFIQDELVFIAPPDNILAGRKVMLQDLVNQALILREPGSGSRKVFLERLDEKNISFSDLTVIMEVGSTRAIITAVEAGLGIGIVSRWAVRDALKLGAVKEIQVEDFSGKRDLYLVTSNSKYMGKAAQAFLEFLQEKIPYVSRLI